MTNQRNFIRIFFSFGVVVSVRCSRIFEMGVELLFLTESSVLFVSGPLVFVFVGLLLVVAAVCCACTGRWSSCTLGYSPGVTP